MQNERGFLDGLYELKESGTGGLLVLIESGAFAYSVLHMLGYRMHYPVAAIIHDWETADILVDMLGIFERRSIDSNISARAFAQELSRNHDDVTVLIYSPGRNTANNMETLLSACASGKIEGRDIVTPFVVVFLKIIPEEFQEKFSLVLAVDQKISKDIVSNNRVEFLEFLKNYVLENFQVLKYKFGKESNNNKKLPEVKDAGFWNAAITMLEAAFEKDIEESTPAVRKYLENAVMKGRDMADSYEFIRQIPGAFRESFILSIPRIGRMVDRTEASDLNDDILKKTILFDSYIYYIPDEVFSFICDSLKDICTINQVKEALEKEGILCTQGRGRVYRTIKLSIGTHLPAQRYIWLKREHLDGNGIEMTLEERTNIKTKGE
ncbi:MAG: hypothetical protein LBT06_05005 [Hungatella sp.]|jgi:esterase/lipase superfamily enzyme|nr:hypothetical protein [Hungatella sp.]